MGPMEVGVKDGEGIAGLKDDIVLESIAGAPSKGEDEQREEKTKEEDGYEGFNNMFSGYTIFIGGVSCLYKLVGYKQRKTDLESSVVSPSRKCEYAVDSFAGKEM
ncbi:hypothetical protein ACLOJK_013080 [Asimina triloba]